MRNFGTVVALILIVLVSCKKEKSPQQTVAKTTVSGVDSIMGSYMGTTQVIDRHDSGSHFGTRFDTSVRADTIFVSKISDTLFRVHFNFKNQWIKFPIDDTVKYRDSNSYFAPHPVYGFNVSFYPKGDSLKLTAWWSEVGLSGGIYGGIYSNTTFNGKR